MLKKLLTLLFILITFHCSAQNYNNFFNYTTSVTPANGVKIKTKIPFMPGIAMPTIMINGYSYGTNEPIGLTITFYVYSKGPDFNNPNNYYFHQSAVSSSGAYTPVIKLSAEDGMVVIFIDDKNYYQRFTISAYATGVHEEPVWFQGWTVSDKAIVGTPIIEIPYVNRFKGTVILPGNGVWNKEGNVGIGTQLPKEKLSVNGKIRTHEIKVEIDPANWPDFVFENSYSLPTLHETESFIKKNGHLPGIPSAKQVKENGLDLGDMNAKLLQKIEELTLHLIEMEKKNIQLQKTSKDQEEKIQLILSKIKL